MKILQAVFYCFVRRNTSRLIKSEDSQSRRLAARMNAATKQYPERPRAQRGGAEGFSFNKFSERNLLACQLNTAGGSRIIYVA